MAFPLTPEAALCSCFRILLQDLAPILRSKDLLSFWDIGPELKIFQKKISKVQDLLNNAEERSQEICVSSWMDDLRELSYDMENLVDEMNIERVRMEQQLAIRNQADTSHHVANIRYTYRDNIEDYRPYMNNVKKWMNDALGRLDEVLVEANDLELKPQVARKSPASSIASRVEAGVGASMDKSDVYGRQKDQEFVIQELLSFSHSSKKNYSTISIVGMGGVGKTTLARLIFHDQRVADFDIRSWACVSDAFDSTKVVKELIEYATGENVSNMAPSALCRRLEDMLNGKKILIVLDDVWEVKAWDSLNVSFTHCAQGSKILVTTRNKNVGNCISSNECYELETLEDEDCWHLFKGVAFGEVVDENLAKIGREIVKKCGGVPLAVKVIGSTLRFASAERWENALSNKLWQLEDVARDGIFPALKLSYRYLPSPIKRCFGYLSLFPTDYELNQYKVVRLWIAEGFIEDREGRSWEDIGDEYYEELQRRCLIQEDDMMHDLIHSLACSVSGKFSHHFADGTGSCMHMESVRHLSVTDEDIDLGALDGNKHLRTLLLLSDHFSEKIFDQGLLRVLELRVPPRLEELPSSVQNLKCLRYLHLSMMGSIEYLPDSICELRNLQTLDLEGCYCLRSLPNDIGNLQKLRYLYLRKASLSSLPDSICKLEKLRVLNLYSCKSFSNLPDEIGSLQDLMELDLSYTLISHLPKSIGNLHNLRNLDIDYCKRLTQLPEDIGNLVSLRGLRLQKTCISSLPDSICKLEKLRVLKLVSCKSFSNLPDEIGALQDLMELDLSYTLISHLPKSIGNLCNLRNLDIVACERLTQLPEDIGNLVSLQELRLKESSISSLPDSICKLEKLRVLDLFSCKSLSNIPDEIGALQDLMEMDLCYTLISHLPKSIGNLCNLRNLDIVGCERLTQLPEDIGNLVSLRELRLQKSSISSLPDSICKLRNLRKLDIDRCDRLAQLPEDVCNLSSLERFSFDMNRVKRLPRGIGKLRNLEELGEFVVWKEEGWGIEELNGMNKLKGPLTISHLENVDGVEKAFSARLKSKMGIDSLCFKWSSLNDASDAGLATRDDGETVTKILDALEPCPNGLTTLSFVNYPGERVPTWMSKLRFPFLEDLTMDGLQCVERVMDVELPSLEFLTIQNCPKLRVVSMGLPKLVCLDVSRCQELTTLGMIPPRQSYASEIPPMLPSFMHRNSLLSLTIKDCPALVSFFEEGLPPMLQNLKIASCTSLRRLSRGLQQSTLLLSLTIKDCTELVSFPEEGLPPMLKELKIASCTSLRHLPRGLQHNTSLHSLWIKDCPTLVSFPEEGLPPMLRKLEIASCTSLRHLSRGLQHSTSLLSLTIKDRPELVSFPEDGLPPMLQNLKIASCTNLRHLSRGLQQSTLLLSLTIKDCTELVSFPEEGLPPMLKELKIASCTSLRHLPRGLQHNTSLHSLWIKDCPALVSFPEEGLPPMLRKLEIASCTSLRHLSRGLQHSTSLLSLTIKDPELVSFPEDGLPPMLQILKIVSCTSLRHLSRGLQQSTSLFSLTIKDCLELVSFPQEGLPPMLHGLFISDCTNLRHLPTGLRDLTSLQYLELDSCPVLGVSSDDQLPPGLKTKIVNCSKLEQQLKDEDRKDWLTKSSS